MILDRKKEKSMYIKTIDNKVLKVARIDTLKVGTFYYCRGGSRDHSIPESKVVEKFETLKAVTPAILESKNFKDDYVIANNQPQWIWS